MTLSRFGQAIIAGVVAFVAWLIWTLDYAKPFRCPLILWLLACSEQRPQVLTVGGMLVASIIVGPYSRMLGYAVVVAVPSA